MDLQKMGERYLRQQDWADPTKFKMGLTVLGCGSHGSIIAIAASKLGVAPISLVDPDLFESHNVPNQFCLETSDLGVSKVQALSALCKAMGARVTPRPYFARLGPKGLLSSPLSHEKGAQVDIRACMPAPCIVVSAPDNMEARKSLAEVCSYNLNTPWLIDSRQAGMYIQIHCVNMMDRVQVHAYRETLYDDKEASVDPCGARSVIDLTLYVGAWVSTMMRHILMNKPVYRGVSLDVSRGELNLTMSDGKVITNREAIALWAVGEGKESFVS